MFQRDIGLGGSSSSAAAGCSTSSTYMTYNESSNSNKHNSTEFNFGKAEDSSDFDAHYPNFCFGVSILYIFCVFLVDISYHPWYTYHTMIMRMMWEKAC